MATLLHCVDSWHGNWFANPEAAFSGVDKPGTLADGGNQLGQWSRIFGISYPFSSLRWPFLGSTSRRQHPVVPFVTDHCFRGGAGGATPPCGGDATCGGHSLFSM